MYHRGMRRLIVIATLFFIAITQPAHALDAIGPGMYDQNIPQIVFSGSGFAWTTASDGLGYGGTRITSGATTSTNPRIEFDIWGGGFALHIVANSTGGTANMCVDGVCNAISWYAVSTTITTISVTGLSYGVHTVSIQKTSSTSSAINLDGLYVAPPPNPPTVIPPTPIVVITMVYPTVGTQVVNVGNWDEMTVEVTDDAPYRNLWDVDAQPVAFDYKVDAGQIVMVSLLVVIVVVMLIMLWMVFSKVSSK